MLTLKTLFARIASRTRLLVICVVVAVTAVAFDHASAKQDNVERQGG